LLATALVGFIVGQATLEVSLLTRTPRSNAREVAFSIERQLLPEDLLILAPAWYSASFNHYFGDAIDQIDYPHAGRLTMTDFADTWEHAYDPLALEKLRMRIAQARKQGRRVWLVSERQHLIAPSTAEVTLASKNHQAGALSRASVADIRDMLYADYGEPTSIMLRGGRTPRYDDIRAFLYSPKNSRRIK
jgi:hypothetical protein